MRNSSKRFEIRKQRIRAKISRITTLPRLSVFKSNQHIYAQIINDNNIVTSASTLEKDIRQIKKSNCNKTMAEKIGSLIAKRAEEKGIKEVVFDRGGYKYHGVIKALADSARTLLSF